MGKYGNRNRQRNRQTQIAARKIEQLQPRVVSSETAAQQNREAFDLGREEERRAQAERNETLRQLADLVPAKPTGMPRQFGEARVFRMDGGFRVTIDGDGDSTEQEIFIEHETDRTVIFTGDAALQRRIAKQQGMTGFSPSVHAPAPQPLRSRSADAPAGVGDPVADPSRPYDGIGPPPRDYQDRVLADVGIDLKSLAGAVDPAAGNMIAELVQG